MDFAWLGPGLRPAPAACIQARSKGWQSSAHRLLSKRPGFRGLGGEGSSLPSAGASLLPYSGNCWPTSKFLGDMITIKCLAFVGRSPSYQFAPFLSDVTTHEVVEFVHHLRKLYSAHEKHRESSQLTHSVHALLPRRRPARTVSIATPGPTACCGRAYNAKA